MKNTNDTTLIKVLEETVGGSPIYIVPTGIENSTFQRAVLDLQKTNNLRDFFRYLYYKEYITPEEWEYLYNQFRRASFYKAYRKLRVCVEHELSDLTVDSRLKIIGRHVLLSLVRIIDRLENISLVDNIREQKDRWETDSFNCELRIIRSDANRETFPSGIVSSSYLCGRWTSYPGKPGKFILMGSTEHSYLRHELMRPGENYVVIEGVVLGDVDNDYLVDKCRTSINNQYRYEYGRETPYYTDLVEMDKRDILTIGGSTVSTKDLKAIVTTEDGLLLTYFNYYKTADVLLPIEDRRSKEYIHEYLTTKLV